MDECLKTHPAFEIDNQVDQKHQIRIAVPGELRRVEDNPLLEAKRMLCIEIPERLSEKITLLAILAEQTPEQMAVEILEERIDHQSAYLETAYLKSSARNRERLDQAIHDIRRGTFEPRALIDD